MADQRAQPTNRPPARKPAPLTHKTPARKPAPLACAPSASPCASGLGGVSPHRKQATPDHGQHAPGARPARRARHHASSARAPFAGRSIGRNGHHVNQWARTSLQLVGHGTRGTPTRVGGSCPSSATCLRCTGSRVTPRETQLSCREFRADATRQATGTKGYHISRSSEPRQLGVLLAIARNTVHAD